MITAKEFEDIAVAMLTEGVPPGVVARVLRLDPDLVKQAQSKLRIRKYGTDDMTEYLEQIQWDTLDEVRTIIRQGSPADKVRFAAVMFGKQIAVASRRTPEKTREVTDRVTAMLEEMRIGEPREPRARSEFVAFVGDPDDQDENGQAP